MCVECSRDTDLKHHGAEETNIDHVSRVNTDRDTITESEEPALEDDHPANDVLHHILERNSDTRTDDGERCQNSRMF